LANVNYSSYSSSSIDVSTLEYSIFDNTQADYF
jgi:hypothetical protein